MKATFKTSSISSPLKQCFLATDQKDAKRSNIMFTAEGERLTLSATNAEYSVEINFPCEVDEEGSCVVDGKMVSNVIAKALGSCELSTDSRSLIVKSNGRTKITNVNCELPMIEDTKGKHIAFNAVEFKNAVNTIEYAIAEDQTRLILTGAHIVSDGHEAVITGLDGFRLAQAHIHCFGDEIDIVVPARALRAICNAIIDGDIDFYSNGSRIMVKGDNFKINAVLLTGQYIDTSRIIPTSFKTSALLKTANVRNLFESSSVASGSVNIAKMIIDENSVSVTGNSEQADFLGETDAVVTGDVLTIAFNIKYISQLLQNINTEECIFSFNSSVNPVVVMPKAEGNKDLHLVLPVRIFS